jgi:hypothetical protein
MSKKPKPRFSTGDPGEYIVENDEARTVSWRAVVDNHSLGFTGWPQVVALAVEANGDGDALEVAKMIATALNHYYNEIERQTTRPRR